MSLLKTSVRRLLQVLTDPKYVDDNYRIRRGNYHSCKPVGSVSSLASVSEYSRVRSTNTYHSVYHLIHSITPHLDGKHVMFGQVINGKSIIRERGCQYDQPANTGPVWSLAKPLPHVLRPGTVPTKDGLRRECPSRRNKQDRPIIWSTAEPKSSNQPAATDLSVLSAGISRTCRSFHRIKWPDRSPEVGSVERVGCGLMGDQKFVHGVFAKIVHGVGGHVVALALVGWAGIRR